MKQEIVKTMEVLNSGGVILYPTDTIWGIGCDATNAGAVEKINRIKRRQKGSGFIILLGEEKLLGDYVVTVPEIVWDLLAQVDTPLTIIYPGGKNVAPNVLAEDGSLGIRIVKDAFCRDLLQAFKRPIVSTSANLSGELAPVSFRQVSAKILKSVDYQVNWNRDVILSTKASSIVKIGLKGEIELIRA